MKWQDGEAECHLVGDGGGQTLATVTLFGEGLWTAKVHPLGRVAGRLAVLHYLSASPLLTLGDAKWWAEEAVRRVDKGQSPDLIAAELEMKASLALCRRWQESLLPLFLDNDGLKLHVFEHPSGIGLVMRWFGLGKGGNMFVSIPTKEPNEAELEMVRTALAKLGLARSKHGGG